MPCSDWLYFPKQNMQMQNEKDCFFFENVHTTHSSAPTQGLLINMSFLEANSMVLVRFFINWIQASVICKEIISAEKILLSYWPVGKSVWISYWLCYYRQCHPWAGFPSWYKKADWTSHGESWKQCSATVCSNPLLQVPTHLEFLL